LFATDASRFVTQRFTETYQGFTFLRRNEIMDDEDALALERFEVHIGLLERMRVANVTFLPAS
jgi:hypothetical protein